MAHPSPPLLYHRTTTQILKTTNKTIFFSGINHLIYFLILSFLLYSLQNNTHIITHEITSYIDNTPSIKTILTRTENPPKPTSPFTTTRRHHRHRITPFHQTLDGSILSIENELNQRTFLDTLLKIHVNATLFLLDSFDHHVGPTFIEFQKTVKENVSSSSSSIAGGTNDSHVMHHIMLLFDLKFDEGNTLLGLVSVFCVSYGFMLATFVATSAWAHGFVFVLVVDILLQTRKSLFRIFMDGLFCGVSRMTRFVGMRLILRDALSQLLGALFFHGVKDNFTLINVYIWVKFLPFSFVSPWVKGYEYEFWWILFLFSVLEWSFSFILDVGAWVVMVDSRKRGREVINEGCHLFLLMFYPALNLKFLEYIIRSLFVRITLKRAFGEKVALALESFMEVYFMVAWLIFYFFSKVR